MNKRDLKKLSKSELIKLLLKQEKKKKPEIIVVDDTKPSSPKTSERPKNRKWFITRIICSTMIHSQTSQMIHLKER